MHLFLSYTISGLVIGAVYGIAASGLVLTYTTSGIFNFAHGAIAMLAAYVYWQFRFGWNWPAPLCLILVLLILAPLLGALLYAGIMRGLRNTAEVTKIVVTVSVLLGILALAQWIWNPTTPRNDFPFFGYTAKFKFLGVFVTDHEVIAIGAAVAIAVGLRYLFQRTRTGVAMRAVVDNPALLELNGGRPGRLAGISWAMGGALAALAGILITPISGGTLDVLQLTLLVLAATAAAMFGRLRSLPRTFLGAIVLGLASNYVLAYFPTTWTWASNFRISLPMIVLFVVLLILPQDRLRGAILLRSRERFKVPSMQSAGLWSIILLAVILLLEVTMTGSAITALTVGMSFAIIALSLTLLTGYAGEINLAPVSLGAIATIFAFHLGLSGVGLHQRMTLGGILIGVAATAVIGGLIALPALRLRGLYLALATLAFGVFVSDMLLNDITPHILPIFHTHFSIFTNGTLNIPKIKVGPLDLAAPKAFLTTVTVVFIVIGIGLIALRHSAYGRRLAAMKDSPAATATLGQNLVLLKLSVFVFSAAIAGLGGILMSSASISVNPNTFIIFISLTLVMLTVVGGVGNVTGALIGGLLAGVGFQAITSTFQNIYAHHGGPWSFIANLSLVAPAAIGVSLGRNPSGSVGQIVEGYAPLWRAKPVLAGGIMLELAAYLLVVTKVMSNWWLVLATLIIGLALPLVGKALMPEAFAPPTPPTGSPPDSSREPVAAPATSASRAPAATGSVRMGLEGGSTSGHP
jgi:branched-subunit amino acid ABC-type transport system permease component